jgi:hypothetical protein
MSATDDELDDIDFDQDETPVLPAEPELELTAEQKRIAELEGEITKVKSGSDSKMAELLELGKQFLANQNRPTAPVIPDRSADVRAFGEQIQKAVISGSGEEVANLLIQGMGAISDQHTNAALTRYGNPMAEKAGRVAVSDFLAQKEHELGPDGKKTHDLVAKGFALTPEERSWVATASDSDVQGYLTRKYEQAAGQVLLRSAGRARPRNIAGSGAGGPNGGLAASFPGVEGKRAKELERLAEAYWPDPVVRAAKLKVVAAELAAGAA